MSWIAGKAISRLSIRIEAAASESCRLVRLGACRLSMWAMIACTAVGLPSFRLMDGTHMNRESRDWSPFTTLIQNSRKTRSVMGAFGSGGTRPPVVSEKKAVKNVVSAGVRLGSWAKAQVAITKIAMIVKARFFIEVSPIFCPSILARAVVQLAIVRYMILLKSVLDFGFCASAGLPGSAFFTSLACALG